MKNSIMKKKVREIRKLTTPGNTLDIRSGYS